MNTTFAAHECHLKEAVEQSQAASDMLQALQVDIDHERNERVTQVKVTADGLDKLVEQHSSLDGKLNAEISGIMTDVPTLRQEVLNVVQRLGALSGELKQESDDRCSA